MEFDDSGFGTQTSGVRFEQFGKYVMYLAEYNEVCKCSRIDRNYGIITWVFVALFIFDS